MRGDGMSRYGLELVQAAGVVGCASETKEQVSSSSGSSSSGSSSGGENPFDTGPGGINQPAAANSNMAPGFDSSAATCLLANMFRDDFANVIAARTGTAVNMCGRSLVGQCLHSLSMPHVQFDRYASALMSKSVIT